MPQNDPESVETAAARRLTDALAPSTIDALLADVKAAGTPIDGVDGLLNQMTKAVLERALQTEMTHHLGYGRDDPAGAGTGNSCNGFGVENGVHDQRAGHDLGAAGPEWRVRVADRAETGAAGRADRRTHRPVDEVYPIVYVDGIWIKVRTRGAVTIKSAHLVIGVNVDGRKHALGCWIARDRGREVLALGAQSSVNRSTARCRFGRARLSSPRGGLGQASAPTDWPSRDSASGSKACVVRPDVPTNRDRVRRPGSSGRDLFGGDASSSGRLSGAPTGSASSTHGLTRWWNDEADYRPVGLSRAVWNVIRLSESGQWWARWGNHVRTSARGVLDACGGVLVRETVRVDDREARTDLPGPRANRGDPSEVWSACSPGSRGRILPGPN